MLLLIKNTHKIIIKQDTIIAYAGESYDTKISRNSREYYYGYIEHYSPPTICYEDKCGIATGGNVANYGGIVIEKAQK